MPSVFSRYGPAQWWVPGAEPIFFPVVAIQEDGGNAIVGHKRYGQDGERLDDTGSEAKVYTLETEWFSSDRHESEVDGIRLYPSVLNQLLDSFDIHETGDLYVPTKGLRRCRAHKYTRREQAGEVDVAHVTLIFREDNEDDAGDAADLDPVASAVLGRTVRDAVELLQWDTAGTFSLADIQELADGLVAIANAPGDAVADVENKANALIRAVERVDDAFTGAANDAQEEVATLLTDPSSSRVTRLLARIRDTTARVTSDKFATSGRVIKRTYARRLSIFDVSTKENQNPVALININPQLPDLLDIPAGTVVRIFDRIV